MTRLLIVDDDTNNLEILALIFEDSDLDIFCIEKAAGLPGVLLSFKPDIILLDIKLEDGDGIRICNELKHDSATSHIAIILISAAYTHEKIEAIACKADLFIEKPFDIHELRAAVERFV